MRDRLAPYAPVVFWAGAAVVGLGVVVLLFGGRGPVPIEYMLIGGAVLVVLSALMRPDVLLQALGLRSVRFGGNTLLLSAAFIAILGLLNFIGTRRTWREDFTADQQFSLSPQSIQILQNLRQPVKATAFYSPNAFGRQEAEDRLKEYALHSSNFSYEILDTEQQIGLARQLGVTRDGSVIFESGSKKQEAISTSESDFTGAIIKVTSDKARKAYFVSGHRERDPNEFGVEGYSSVRQWLEKDNYAVATLTLLVTPTVPADTTVLIVASPQAALTEPEIKAIAEYLDQGGRLFVLTDPLQPEPLGALLAEKWGVKFRNDYVIDQLASVRGDPLQPVVQQYGFSTITQKMKGLVTVFPFARSIQRIDPAPASASVQAVVQTSADSWGETNLQDRNPRFDEGADVKGPLDVLVSIEGTTPVSPTTTVTGTLPAKSRLVVMGNSEFVANGSLQAFPPQLVRNIDLFMNAVNWLAEEEALISIRPTPFSERSVFMTDAQRQGVFVLSVFMLPGVVLVAGLSVWWRRR